MREERLHKLFANVNDWLKYGEAKNLGLLTLNAAMVFGFTQIDFDSTCPIQVAGQWVFCPLAGISFLVALLSLFPILSKIDANSLANSWIRKFSEFIDHEATFENIHYYGFLRGLDEPRFENLFLAKTNDTNGPFNDYEKELATQILYNSRITWLKFQLFKIGAFILGLAIVLAIVAVIVVWLIDVFKK